MKVTNETHTMVAGTATFACDGKKMELAPGSFNYMPSKEAWPSAHRPRRI